MTKLEKRLRAEWGTDTTGCAFQVFLQKKYDEAVSKNQFALANEIEVLMKSSVS